MEGAFTGCINLDVLAEDNPNLDEVFSMRRMFFACFNLKNENNSLSTWKVDNVIDMNALFKGDLMFNANIFLMEC